MSRRKDPTPHLWLEGGGMVTRCDDPAVARPLLLAEYVEEQFLCPDDYDTPAEYEADVAELFPLDKAQVQRGRVEPRDPDMNDGYSWIWRPLPADRSGRGITTAVVWSENQ